MRRTTAGASRTRILSKKDARTNLAPHQNGVAHPLRDPFKGTLCKLLQTPRPPPTELAHSWDRCKESFPSKATKKADQTLTPKP